MPSRCWMPSCLPWASGSRATTARRSAKCCAACCRWRPTSAAARSIRLPRSEEHTSELQSLRQLACRRPCRLFPSTTPFRSDRGLLLRAARRSAARHAAAGVRHPPRQGLFAYRDRKSTRLNSSHLGSSHAGVRVGSFPPRRPSDLIAGYYCAPLGEVLRGMLPLASDIRRGKVYSLTDAGRDAARQLLFDSSPEDPVVEILRMLDRRPLSAAYLERKLPLAANALRALERKRFVMVEQVQTERDPLRAPSDRLRVEATVEPAGAGPRGHPAAKLGKPERELLAFLELHPGSHNLKDLESMVRDASPAARALVGDVKWYLPDIQPDPVVYVSYLQQGSDYRGGSIMAWHIWRRPWWCGRLPAWGTARPAWPRR